MSGVNMSMTEVTCQKAVDNANFVQGVQRYIWSTGRPTVWSPSRSYLRVKLRVTGAGTAALGSDTSPKMSEAIALAENCVANAYSNAYFLGGGATISQITNFFGQASMVEARTTNALGWSDSIGLGSYAWNGDFTSRCAAISRSAMRNSYTAAAPPTANIISTVTSPLPGFAQNEGKQAIIKPIDLSTAANANNASVAIAETTGILTLAGGANFADAAGVPLTTTDSYLGATLVVDGIPYILKSGGATGNLVAFPPPAANNGVIATTNWYLVVRTTSRARQAQNWVDVCFRPTGLGIWNYDGWLGAGDWQLALVPDSNYINNMLQTLSGNTCSVAVLDVRLYVCTMQMSIPDQVSTLHLREFAVQTKPATGVSSNLSFSVPPSTEMLYVFLQSNSTGASTIYPPSRFAVANNLQSNIQSCQITYANRSSPMMRWDSAFVAPKSVIGGTAVLQYVPNSGTTSSATDAQDLLSQLYTQSQMELGKANDAAGTETYDAWLQRGVLLAFNFVRDSADRSTEVQLNLAFNVDPGTANVFLCAEYRRVVEITQANGMITSVRSLNT